MFRQQQTYFKPSDPSPGFVLSATRYDVGVIGLNPEYRFVRNDHGFRWGLLWSILLVLLGIGFNFSGVLNHLEDGDPYVNRRVGFLRGHFCYFVRDPAGRSPPTLEPVVGRPFTVSWERHVNTSFADYVMLVIPAWPAILLLALPAVIWIKRDWPTRSPMFIKVDDPRRGFEPINLDEDRPG